MFKKISLILIFFLLVFGGLFFFVKKNKPKSIVRSLDQMWGESTKGMYPELDKPSYLDTKEASKFLTDDDEIILLSTKKGYRAYPNFILGFHHVVNEEIDGVPVAITYCCQTDSAIVYQRKVDGQILHLAALGPLYYGNKVMYDRETDSYWLQLTGEAFFGKLAGKKLAFFAPVDRTTWGRVKQFSRLTVLVPIKEIKFYREWYANMKQGETGLFALRKKKAPDERLPAYTQGLGIKIGNQAFFFPLSVIKEKGSIQKTVGNISIKVVYDQRLGSSRIYNTSQDKRVLPYTQVYWFSWSAFFPETEIVN